MRETETDRHTRERGLQTYTEIFRSALRSTTILTMALLLLVVPVSVVAVEERVNVVATVPTGASDPTSSNTPISCSIEKQVVQLMDGTRGLLCGYIYILIHATLL